MSYRQQGYRPKAGQFDAGPQRKTATRKRAPSSSQTPNRKKPKQRKRHPFRTFFLLVLFALVATVGVMAYTVYEKIATVQRVGTFYPGVYVDGVELYGATPQQAYEYLFKQSSNQVQDFEIRITFEDKVWMIDSDTLGMSDSMVNVIQNELNNAYKVGRSETTLLGRYKVYLQLQSEPYMGYTSGIEKSMSQIESMLEEIRQVAYIQPQDASRSFHVDRKNPVVTVEATYGRDVDIDALKAQIVGMVNNMEAGTLQVQTYEIVPSVTVADLPEIVQLANFSTNISSRSTEDRNKNIEKGCEFFNGLIVKDGQTVSFNGLVGNRTEERGFYPALEIVSGEYRDGWGGGICQVSSTLYNAVIQANLQVVSRTNHGIPVNYLEMGADATVADRGIDFKFKNDTGSDIYIIARVETNGKSKTCLFQIYGRPEPNGYSYSLRHETLEVIPAPSTTPTPDRKAEYVTYTDQVHVVSEPKEGYVVNTYLVVKDQYGNIVSQDKKISTDTYKAQAGKSYVGVSVR